MHETKEYHKYALQVAKDYLETNEDRTKSAINDKISDGKCEHNIHIIKIILNYSSCISACRIKDSFKRSQRTRFFK